MNHVKVTKRQFYETIRKMDVTPRPVGEYPYTSIFYSPDQQEHGRIVSELIDGKYPPISTYYLTSGT